MSMSPNENETRAERIKRIGDKDEILRNHTTFVCFQGQHADCAASAWCLCDCHPPESTLTGEPPKPRSNP